MPTVGRFRYLEAPPAAAVRARGTLVLLHAFPLNARMWEPQLALAAHGWRVIAPQLRGFDGGDGAASAATVDDFAGDVIDLLDALHIHEAVIGGLSMGGYVALAMFRHAARYFQGLLLADTRAEADTPEATAGRKRMIALAQERGASAVADEMLPKLLGATTRGGQPAVAEHVRSLILSNSSTAIVGALTAIMTRADSAPLLHKVHCPALVVVGSEDAITPLAMSEALQRGIAGSELAVIPNAGHLSSLEQPEAFNAAVAGFLANKL